MYSSRAACLLTCCTLLTACGDGGGNAANAFATPLRITGANAVSVSAAATVESSAAVADIVLGVGGGRGASRPDLTAFSQRQLRRLAFQIHHGPVFAAPSVIAAATTLTSDCDNTQGSFNIIIDDADNSNSLTSSDTFTIAFDECYDASEDASFDGSLTLSNVAFVGDPETDPAWSLSSTFFYDDLSYTDAAGTGRIAGNVNFLYQTADSINFSSTLSSTVLSYSGGGKTASLRDFTIASRENINTLAYAIEASGTLSGSELGGSIEIETLAPLAGLYPNDPAAGILKISGADDCSVTLTAIDDTNVQLDIDQNGDSAIDGTISTTWGELT